MLHAIRNATKIAHNDEFTMIIGPGRDSTLLEVGLLHLESDDPVVIHAMRLRPDFLR